MNLYERKENIVAKFEKIFTYGETRIITGKFLHDISTLIKNLLLISKRFFSLLFTNVGSTPLFQKISDQIPKKRYTLLRIPILNIILPFIIDLLRLITSSFFSILLFVTSTYPLVVLLQTLFQRHILFGLIIIVPMSALLLFCFAVLILSIHNKQLSKKQSFLSLLKVTMQKIPSVFLAYAMQMSGISLLFIGFLLAAFLLSIIFSGFGIQWGTSPLFWLFFSVNGLFVLTALFILIALTQHTFFILLREDIQFYPAVDKAWQLLNKNATRVLILYILFYSFFGVIIYKSILFTTPLQFLTGIYFLLLLFLFFGYNIFHKIYKKEEYKTSLLKNNTIQITILLLIGLINYLFIGLVILKNVDRINTYLTAQQINYAYDTNKTTYTNSIYNYTLEYPKNWTIYEAKPNTVTIYNNDTGTLDGGIWITIDVTPYSARAFDSLYQTPPGDISTDAKQKKYKISNKIIRGYEAVNYTIETQTESPTYQTIYIIRKDAFLYTLTFTTKSKTMEQYRSYISEKVVNSFRFIQ